MSPQRRHVRFSPSESLRRCHRKDSVQTATRGMMYPGFSTRSGLSLIAFASRQESSSGSPVCPPRSSRSCASSKKGRPFQSTSSPFARTRTRALYQRSSRAWLKKDSSGELRPAAMHAEFRSLSRRRVELSCENPGTCRRRGLSAHSKRFLAPSVGVSRKVSGR